jgi:hypothetical protein
MTKTVLELILAMVVVALIAAPFASYGEVDSEMFETESTTAQEPDDSEIVDIDTEVETFVTSSYEEPEVIDVDENKEENNKINRAIEEMNKEMNSISSITDIKEWFIAYKNIVSKYSYILDPPETIYDYFSEEELDLLFHIVQAEVGDEYGFEEKCNVASVIFNRFDNGDYDSLTDVLTAKNQFSPYKDGRYKTVEVDENTVLACEYAFEIGDTTNGCYAFQMKKVNKWYDWEWYMADNCHNFYK